jgi:phosphoribosyl-AMP cyclohydrolase
VTVEQVGAACHTGSHTCFTDELPVAEHPVASRKAEQ